MWDLMEFSPPNTTWQLEHLDERMVKVKRVIGFTKNMHSGLDFRGSIGVPVADAPGEVQAGLVQVGLEAGLPGDAAALWADVRRFVFVDPLVGGDGARVGQHHGGRALRARLQQGRTSQSGLRG